MTDRTDRHDPRETFQSRPAQPQTPEREREFDDGLVHDHSWACTERGAPSH